MNEKHPDSEEFQWYTRFGLGAVSTSWFSPRHQSFEKHIQECDLCARKLANEAQRELAMHDLADGMDSDSFLQSRHWLTAMAAALAFVLVVGISRASSAPSSASHSYSGEIALDAGLLLADGDVALK